MKEKTVNSDFLRDLLRRTGLFVKVPWLEPLAAQFKPLATQKTCGCGANKLEEERKTVFFQVKQRLVAATPQELQVIKTAFGVEQLKVHIQRADDLSKIDTKVL